MPTYHLSSSWFCSSGPTPACLSVVNTVIVRLSMFLPLRSKQTCLHNLQQNTASIHSSIFSDNMSTAIAVTNVYPTRCHGQVVTDDRTNPRGTRSQLDSGRYPTNDWPSSLPSRRPSNSPAYPSAIWNSSHGPLDGNLPANILVQMV